jgi:adenosylcobinamide-phosphate synthase
MAEPIALAALALDAAVGWPNKLYRRVGHPVGLFARLIEGCERAWNQPSRSAGQRRLLGVMTVLLLIALAGGGAWALTAQSRAVLGDFAWLALAALAWPALAQRSLYDDVRAVAVPLRANDIEGARRAVAMIVGRDTKDLDETGIARAAIESLAESFCDGIAAPLFWLLIGGLPGVWSYKAINTADSLIGHREERWRAFGWAAARTDDVLNLIPARVGGVLICLVGGGGWRVLWHDHARHASPNAGWTEAAMAGALGVRLAGPVSYDGVINAKEWIGSGRANVNADDLEKALNIYLRACLALWVIAAAAAGGVWNV